MNIENVGVRDPNQLRHEQPYPYGTGQAAHFNNYLEANQSQQNVADMSDSIATSKLADEFLQESSMTKDDLMNY